MDMMSKEIHSRRAVNGITMVRGAVMAGLLASTLLTALPSTTFADGRDGDRRDDKGRHSLFQHLYNDRNYNGRSPFVSQQASVQQTIAALTAKVDQLMIDNTSLRNALATAQGNISTMQGTVNTMQGTVDTMKVSVETLDKKTADIIPDLGKYIKVDTNVLNGVTGPHILITGANVHVRSGSGFTDDNINVGGTLKGLGNLIIGYNESPAALSRAGSHNLVGGSLNSFSSFGGMVFGIRNTLSGQYATIASGDTNTASGVAASVLGGNQNRATGSNSTVYGGLSQGAVNQNSYSPQTARPVSGN
jgi:prophage DNA circulation protein